MFSIVIGFSIGIICSSSPLHAQIATPRILVPARLSIVTEADLTSTTLSKLSSPSISQAALRSRNYSAGFLFVPSKNCYVALEMEEEERLERLFKVGIYVDKRAKQDALFIRFCHGLKTLGVPSHDIDRFISDKNSVSISANLPLVKRTTTFFALPIPKTPTSPRKLAAFTSDPVAFMALLHKFNNPPPQPPQGREENGVLFATKGCDIESACFTPESGWEINVRCGQISTTISTNGAVSVSMDTGAATITTKAPEQNEEDRPLAARSKIKNDKIKTRAPKNDCELESICFTLQGGLIVNVKCGELSASISTDAAISISTSFGRMSITALAGHGE